MLCYVLVIKITLLHKIWKRRRVNHLEMISFNIWVCHFSVFSWCVWMLKTASPGLVIGSPPPRCLGSFESLPFTSESLTSPPSENSFICLPPSLHFSHSRSGISVGGRKAPFLSHLPDSFQWSFLVTVLEPTSFSLFGGATLLLYPFWDFFHLHNLDPGQVYSEGENTSFLAYLSFKVRN